jgi:hypothetical protein
MDSAFAVALIGVGGTVIVGLAGLWASIRSTAIAAKGQAADRYSKAIDELGSDKLSVRIGGIYALERLVRDSPQQNHSMVMELLTAFIREESREPWPPSGPNRLTRPDIQVALLVIGRRDTDYDREPRALSINLQGADLPGADLTWAKLWETNLTYVNLTGARLDHANLAGAKLNATSLEDANLAHAKLAGARLNIANLTGANLTDANLTEARLNYAKLANARFNNTDLARADLNGADLADAWWPADAKVPAGWQRDAGRLKRADANSGNPPTDAASGA